MLYAFSRTVRDAPSHDCPLRSGAERKAMITYHVRAALVSVHWAIRRALARTGQVMSIICDDMTKQKTVLPRHCFVPKELSGAQDDSVPYDLTGVLTHGVGMTAYFSHGAQNYGKTNKMCAVILQQINQYKLKFGRLPPKLHLQLDNTSTNKCHQLMGFLSTLLLSGLFKEIEVRS